MTAARKLELDLGVPLWVFPRGVPKVYSRKVPDKQAYNLLRLGVRLARKEELASTVVQSLRILLAIKPGSIFHVCKQVFVLSAFSHQTVLIFVLLGCLRLT